MNVADYTRAAAGADPNVTVSPTPPQQVRRTAQYQSPWVWNPARYRYEIRTQHASFAADIENGRAHPEVEASRQAKRRAGAASLSFRGYRQLLGAAVLTALTVAAIASIITVMQLAHVHL